jgi:hypothetical protein
MAEMVTRMNIRTPRGSPSFPNIALTPYSGGSDHNVFIDRKIPGMMLGHSPDYTHHTSEDTPDKVDPVELERSEVLATSAFWYLANLTGEQGVELAYVAGARAAGRLGEAAREGIRHLLAAPPQALSHAWSEAENRIDHHKAWAQTAVRDILHFNDEAAVLAAVGGQVTMLERQAEGLLTNVGDAARSRGAEGSRAPPLPRSTDRRVPIRLTRGPLAGGLPASRLSPDRAGWYTSPQNLLRCNYAFELVNFIDGRRDITAIRDALSAELGPVPTEMVARFVEDLVEAGLAAWEGGMRNCP